VHKPASVESMLGACVNKDASSIPQCVAAHAKGEQHA
jgi:hypothetical protein